ncbi:MAG: NAD(P)-dependent glycerol-3-phosphate dehydrogenase [Rhodobacteraceae bacterium]|nr:NAD(P)-dependent glycerol-3-phosphate dehydrogenase [Paracoccaceae bacterium]
MNREPIDIAGAGAFGTALAITLAVAGHPVTLWAREGAEEIQLARENIRRLPGHTLPKGVRVTSVFQDLRAGTLLLAIPTQSLDRFLASHAFQAGVIISCAKGVHFETGTFPTGLITRHCPGVIAAQLTGPGFARDIADGLPTALTLACASATDGARLQHCLTTPNLRFYRGIDVIGAEVGGALKNVIAIGCGAAIGAGLGDSARAALMTRGFAEMVRLAAALGARAETLSGLSGLGDLALTCHSGMSRNFCFGLALGRADAFEEPATVEGVMTAKAVAQMAGTRGIDMPIVTEIARLLDGRFSVAEALANLLSRPLKPE